MNDKESYLAKAKESLASAEADFDEKRYNSCARGSYYACFQAAIYALLDSGVTKPKSDRWRHEFVKGQFVLHLINRKKKYGGYLRDTLEKCSKARQSADYEDKLLTQKESGRMLRLAKNFVDEVLKGDIK